MPETTAMDGVRVSVIVPCYNLGRYLDETVESVLKQTFQNFEILVVDDGSTDADTRALLDDYERPNLQLIRAEHKGLPAAVNLGLAHTTGAYVCVLDADDLLEPGCLEKSVAVLDANPTVAFVSHWVRAFGDESWEWKPTECGLPALFDANTVNSAALVRRSALDAVGGFDESMRDGGEDWDLWIGLVERGFTGRILPEVLFRYRRASSATRRMTRGDGLERLRLRLRAKHSKAYKQHEGSRRAADQNAAPKRQPPAVAAPASPTSTSAKSAAGAEPQAAAAATATASAPDILRLEDERDRLRETVDHSEHERWLSEEKFSEERVHLRAEADRVSLALDMARERMTELETAATRAREEREGQVRALEAAKNRAAQLEAAMNKAREDARALRESMSWRMTGPLRALYGGVRRIFARKRS